MARVSSLFICQQCGYQSPQFLGRCPECGTWNSLVETIEENEVVSGKNSTKKELPKIINLTDIDKINYQRLSTGLEEFDRVLGGGIVIGSIVLVSGDPGIGKSTLLTQLALNVPKILYVAGEESAQQIKLRVDRIKEGANLPILNETDIDAIIRVIEQQKPSLVIIDSIQTLETDDLTSSAGSVGQVKETAHRLQRLAKALHFPIFIVGHVTKEGTIAGPKTLEHLVDAVLSLEGDPASNFRILRATKNRFGPTDEVGVFEMEESGMTEVKNPSKLFLEQKVDAPGSAIAVTMSGYRPLLVEVQALVTKTSLPVPRRSATGIDNNRLQLLTAVVAKRMNLPLFENDVFVNVTGGLKINEPAVDLAVCLAIISSLKNKEVFSQTAFIGEVGLLGELRSVRGMSKRVAEAKKLGFKNIISFENAKSLSEAGSLALK